MHEILLDLTQPQINLNIEQDSQIIGLFIGKTETLVSSKINITHTKPNLKSNTLIKCILFDSSQANIECNLIIEQGAKYTDGYFKIDCLVLSDEAKAKIIPSLEIFENDVKGGHGATVGKINEQQMQYLLSRGLNHSEAQRIIIAGFIEQLIELSKDATIKSWLVKQYEKL